MTSAPELLWLDPRELAADPDNVRTTDDEVEGLAQSIREHGVLQPLGVTRKDGRFRVVYGNRRRQAAFLAGLDVVPCLEVTGPEGDHLVKQLLENLQRRDLNDIEKAEGFARLRRHFAGRDGSPDEHVARVLGISVRTVQRYLGLRDLPAEVRDLIQAGDLTVTQAQHLRTLGDDRLQIDVAHLVVRRGLSAATTSRVCQALSRQPGMSAEEALSAVEEGRELPDFHAGRTNGHAPAAANPSPARDPLAESDDDLWADDSDPDEEPEYQPPTPATAGGHRRFRIRSVDAFCDETARLAQCLQDGDLARAADRDEQAALKLRLAARQIAFISRELADFLARRGWTE